MNIVHIEGADADAFPLLVIGASSTGVAIAADDDIESDTGFRAVSTTAASASCLHVDADRFYADLDCDSTKDAGEYYVDATCAETSGCVVSAITAAGVPAAETDAAHDTCAEIGGCVVGAITTGDQLVFKTIDASSGTDPVADTTTDTLIVAGGTGITVTGDSATDTITIAATGLTSKCDAWPIGSVFTAVVSTSPATLLGCGTWSSIAAGRVLIGLDSGDATMDAAEEEGGAKTVASSAQVFTGTASSVVVNHVHVQNINSGTTGGTNGYGVDTSTSTSSASGYSTANPTSGGAATYTPAGTNAAGAATSVLPPFLVVYFWKRIA